MQQFWVYLLRCTDGSYYAGHTDNLEARLWQHREGLCCDWTRRRRPVELLWCEAAPTREEALAFERRIKGWTRAKKEALIAGDWHGLNWLSRAPHERPSVRAEQSAKRPSTPPAASLRMNYVEARLAPTFEQRPSTSLRTNEAGDRP
jgi:predicted GIY-YIG superfamily endonuclease